jgi:hypothetical protein
LLGKLKVGAVLSLLYISVSISEVLQLLRESQDIALRVVVTENVLLVHKAEVAVGLEPLVVNLTCEPQAPAVQEMVEVLAQENRYQTGVQVGAAVGANVSI